MKQTNFTLQTFTGKPSKKDLATINYTVEVAKEMEIAKGIEILKGIQEAICKT